MKLTWLGTAGFRIEVGETVLYLDPYIRRSAQARPQLSLRLEEITRADYIVVSHGHFDHAMDVPRIAKQTGARVLAPSTVCDGLRNRGVPDPQLWPLEGIKTLGLEDFRVRTIPAKHVRFDRKLILATLRRAWWRLPAALLRSIGYPTGHVMGYLFTSQECSWCFLGSAGYEPELIRDLSPDIALIPMQGRSDIHRVAAQMTALISPKWVIPHHHDDFYPPLTQMIDLEPFVQEVARQAPGTRVFVPKIGQIVEFRRGELRAIQEA